MPDRKVGTYFWFRGYPEITLVGIIINQLPCFPLRQIKQERIASQNRRELLDFLTLNILETAKGFIILPSLHEMHDLNDLH